MPTLVFDYDGTLHDCIRIYAPAFRAACAYLAARGLAPAEDRRDGEIAQWLGLPAGEMWDRFAPALPQEEKARCSRMIGEEMLRMIRAGQARLYPGALELLDGLRTAGFYLVFLSNCKRAYMEAHQREFGLERYFDAFYCAEDYGWISKAELFPVIRERFEGPFAVVGDRRQDMEVAARHGLRAVGCAYGYGTPEELAGADATARSPAEVGTALRALFPEVRR